MKPLVKWLLLFALAMGAIIVLNAQEPVPTRPVKTKSVKQPPVKKVVTPPIKVVRPEIKVIEPEKVPEKEEPRQETTPPTQVNPQVRGQVQAPIQMMDLSTLDAPLVVSQPTVRRLSDPNIYIDERGYGGMSVQTIRRSNGHYVLAYGASTENLDIYTKGIWFELDESLNQLGRARIFTKPDEDMRQLLISERRAGGLDLVYTCNDSRGVYTTGGGQGQRDRNIHGLKFVEFEPGGDVHHRMVDERLGAYDLMALIKPPYCDNTTVLYNYEGRGRLALVDSYLGGYEMYCDLKSLPRVDLHFTRDEPPMDHPRMANAVPFGNDFFIHTATHKKSAYWDLAKDGLSSDIAERYVWPLYILDGFAVSSGQHSKVCHYENHPYHPFTDGDLKLGSLHDLFPLANDHVMAIDNPEGHTRLHVFNDQLQRLYPPVDLPANILVESIQKMELGGDRILLFYKTQEGNSGNFVYRATMYNYADNNVIYNDILWEDPHRDWPPVYRLVRHDANRILAVTFGQAESTYVHEQDLIYRIITFR